MAREKGRHEHNHTHKHNIHWEDVGRHRESERKKKPGLDETQTERISSANTFINTKEFPRVNYPWKNGVHEEEEMALTS